MEGEVTAVVGGDHVPAGRVIVTVNDKKGERHEVEAPDGEYKVGDRFKEKV